MPDWTYHPLRSAAAAVGGRRRSQRAALRALATLTSLPGGFRLVSAFAGRFDAPAGVVERLGVTVPPAVARDAIRAMPALGAGVVEVRPVGPADVPLVRRAAAGRRCRLVVGAAAPEVAAALASDVDRIACGDEPDLVRLSEPDVAAAAAVLADPAVTVLATTDLLVTAGPGWFQRVGEATAPPERAVVVDPRRWPAWWWGLLVGTGMIVSGLVAAAITLGPLLAWYDNDYLGVDRGQLHAINPRLVHFVQHDRISLAGALVAIGVLYAGLATGGMRQGWRWARYAYLASGAVGFPTLFYFIGSGFVDVLHAVATAAMFPMFVLAVRHRPGAPRWSVRPDGPEPVRRRALVGQLLMVVVGAGMLVGGVTISVVGLSSVFVGTDLAFLSTDSHQLHAANPHLVPFIAHDRAGFGGALISAAVAIILLSAWGWRRGESWVWWSLALAAVTGFGPAVVVHLFIGYTSFEHLVPVYLGTALTAVALGLARPFLCRPRVSSGPG
ncbi:hypothetical protein AB0M36_33100 [Actinoplanes sp. NPDC051346]|uniref:hypothetical protein n=1 Tax=Actinoplanes sp. NPDC051346 TaxID=3155048 RepID=UPI0034360ABC